MHPLSISALSSCASTLQQSTIADYVTKELPIAQAGLLANIGADGTKSSGAYPGVVIASPSTSDPDYLYTWTRDSSLVFKTLVDQLITGGGSAGSMSSLIDMFVTAEANIQQVPNPSGNVTTGGLGEPKFLINETAFTGAWGRPQRDGPALRATTLMTYANWLLQQNNASYVTNTLWPIIQLDLDYVASSWNLSTYDLWEEVYALSFFTSAVQHRSLREGSALATTLGHSGLANDYASQADSLLCFLQSFWNSTSGYIVANPGVQRSGIDVNTVLASIHTFDVGAGCDATTYQPCSDKALANLKVYVDSFRGLYTINFGIPANEAVATGRYFEDVYQGGNPWYLTTFAVAEQLYDALVVWAQQGYLNVTDTSLDFFRMFDVSVSTGTYNTSSSTYGTLTCAVQSFADGFVAINANYTPSDGSLAEQYSRTNGTPVSAVDLTWSYASALTAFAAFEGQTPVSWGAQGLSVPSTCYTPVSVTFNVDATTVIGESIYLTGSVPALSNWDPSTAILMSSANYPIWSTTVSLPADTPIQYKYIRKDANSVTWESDPNNAFTTVDSGSQTLNDLWR
ncbi:glycoside hydrolase family 15 protein [Pisolithus marmoratus]|nr:glycoside hydrolase family 15 protein [Pisolithus marmoratus]